MKRKGTVAAVILAAGLGTRFGAEHPKQLALIDGTPAVVRSLDAFDRSPLIGEIVLVVTPGLIASYGTLLSSYEFEKLKCVIDGGDTRMASAIRGMEAISDEMKYIAVHDAARCLVTGKMIKDVCEAAFDYGAAIAASPARDTLKSADKKKNIVSTVPRDNTWYAATPQVFEANLYRAAAYVAKRDGISVTDDASMVEHIGRSVRLVDCGSTNIKITYPEDAAVAEAILRYRKEKST